MKSIKSIILVFLCLATMTACLSSHQVSETFTIVELTKEDALLINNSSKGDMYLFLESLPVYKDGEKAENYSFDAGDEIEVIYDGMILETYPGQFNEVYRINLLN